MPAQRLNYFQATGRRKTATANVRIQKGTGTVVINKRAVHSPPFVILQPLTLTGLSGRFDITAYVRGGGFTSQNEAVRLAIARALLKMDKSLRQTLKKAGFLTRDPRAKERKKPGLKRARRAPQWLKR
jgi:small subunit ribosomal protein S9